MVALNIYLDSMVAIQGIIKFGKMDKRDCRRMLKETNFVLKNLIVYLIDRKTLDIRWIHIRSHTDNLGNDKADKIAKDAFNNNDSSIRWNLDVLIKSKINIKMTAYWNKLHPNCSIRQFTKL